MTWWLRAHRFGEVVAALAVVGVTAWASVSGRFLGVGVPGLAHAGAVTPLSLWLPLAVVAELCRALQPDEGSSRPGDRRRSNELLLLAYCVVVAAVVGLLLLPAAAADAALGLSVARNGLGLIGLALIGRRWLGGLAASAGVAGDVVLTALAGSRPGGSAAGWAWPASAAPTTGTLAAAAGCLVVGLTCVIAPARR